jgi:hypothetical protein
MLTISAVTIDLHIFIYHQSYLIFLLLEIAFMISDINAYFYMVVISLLFTVPRAKQS